MFAQQPKLAPRSKYQPTVYDDQHEERRIAIAKIIRALRTADLETVEALAEVMEGRFNNTDCRSSEE